MQKIHAPEELTFKLGNFVNRPKVAKSTILTRMEFHHDMAPIPTILDGRTFYVSHETHNGMF